MYTQKHFFGIPGQVLQCDYVLDDNGILPKKKHLIVLIKKKRCYVTWSVAVGSGSVQPRFSDALSREYWWLWFIAARP